jgi:hypothetical protein
MPPCRTISTFFFASFILRPAIKVALRWAKPISHNVPAVGDVLAARIRALRSKGQGCQNVGEGWRGNEAQRNDLACRNPKGL